MIMIQMIRINDEDTKKIKTDMRINNNHEVSNNENSKDIIKILKKYVQSISIKGDT